MNVLVAGILLVILQGLCAYADGWLTQGQIARNHPGVIGYAFMEHGGMWADLLIISPILAYTVGKYKLEYTAWWSWMVLIICIGLTLAAGYGINKASLTVPEAHAHDGCATAAGWIHALYSVIGAWVMILFYSSPTRPSVTHADLIRVSIVLTPFFFMGVVKFNPVWFSRWSQDVPGQLTTFIGPIVVWSITLLRIGKWW